MPLLDSAVWSDRLRHTLERYEDSLLRQVAARLFRPRNQWPVDELIERSLATIGNLAVIDRRLKDLESAERQLLALIGLSRQPLWNLGNLVELAIALGHPDGLRPVLTLLEAGLLYPDLPEGISRLKSFEHWLGQAGSVRLRVFGHPEVTARLRDEDLKLPECPGRHDSVAGPAQEADGLEWPLRLAIVWQLAAAAPFRRTQQGSFFKRDLDRLCQNGLLSSAPADSLADLPDGSLLAIALAELEGVVHSEQGELRAGQLPACWEQGVLKALESLWTVLPHLDAWDARDGWHGNGAGHPFPSAYLLALLLLSRLPEGKWAAPRAIEQWLREHHPCWSGDDVRPSHQREWLDAFLLGLAYQLRLVQAARSAEGGWVVRLSPFGRWLLGQEEKPTALPHYGQTLLVQPNLEVLAYRQGLTPALIAELSRFASWKNLGAACVLQLGPESVYRALEGGLTFQSILQALERHGTRALPPTVVDSLRTWADKRERITIYPSATLFEFARAEDLAAALARGLPATRVTDRLVVVSESEVDFRQFRLAGARDYGLPPEKCVEVEADGVTLTIDVARSDLLVETELQRFAEPVDRPGQDGRRTWRLTQASLALGRETGFGLRALEEWFPQRTGHPLSAAARLLATAGQGPPLELRRQLVLRVASAEIADGLLQWPGTRSLIQERLGPTTLVVPENAAATLRERIQQLGATLEEK